VFAAAVVVVVTADVDVVVLLVQDVSNKDGTVTATIRKLNPNPTQNCLLFTFFSFFLFGMQSSIG
jgi:polyphosphate kinase 2 (PPK2 family)